MSVSTWPYLLGVAVGAGMTVQVGMNATLARAAGSPLWASVANFVVGLLVLMTCAFAFAPRPQAAALGTTPAWAWFGGALGAAYVASVTVLGPRIGALATAAFVLVGQLGMALVVDQLGVLGFPRTAFAPTRLVGAALLVVGALLVVRR
jgi:transporter family-2 protein